MSDYVVKVSTAKSCGAWGNYYHVAVLEVDPGVRHVSMISTHARGVRAIVWDSGRVKAGKTERCGLARARAEAHRIADARRAAR